MSIPNLLTQRNLLIFFSFFLNEIFTHITVRSPKELAKQFTNQTIKVGLANFGNIPYGHKIVGNIYYDTTNSSNTIGCESIIFQGLPVSPKVDESPILMVHRGGGCSFVTKVRNVENALAHAAIIINDQAGVDVESVIMADDGRGMEITIPSVLISKEDGDKLLSYYKDNINDPKKLKGIVLEMDFDMENKNNTVAYDLWYTPDQESVYSLLNNLYYYHLELKSAATLKIHFVTYSHFSYLPGVKEAKENCLGSGKYCIRPDPDKVNVTDGRAILKEAINQKCVYKVTYSSNSPDLFWLYLQNFYSKCILENSFTEACSKLASTEAGIPTQLVSECINNSYIASDEDKQRDNWHYIVENTILEEEFNDRKEMMINRIPSLFINKRLFLGSWRADYVFESICAAFKKKPEICYLEGGFEREKKMNVVTLVCVILLILVANVIIFFICMKVIRKKIQERLDASDIDRKIDTVVNSYLQMRETK